MRLSRFLSLTLLITLLCLLYVYQQSEIFRFAYVGQKKQVALNELLDKNSFLRYNIARNASLVEIGSKISGRKDYEMPDTYRLVRVVASGGGLRLKEAAAKKESLFSRLFGVKRQAEAKTINP